MVGILIFAIILTYVTFDYTLLVSDYLLPKA